MFFLLLTEVSIAWDKKKSNIYFNLLRNKNKL